MASNETDPTDSGGETTHAAIVHSSDDAIISYDLADKVTSWNGGAERLFGYTADEILGQPITTLIPPHQRGEALAAFQRLQSGERVAHYETVRRRKDGSLVDVSLTLSALRDAQGRMIGASKIVRDITEATMVRHRQDLLLGEMRHRIRNLVAVMDALGRSALPKNEPVTEQFFAAFMGRVRALLGAGEIVVTSALQTAELSEIAKLVLDPFVMGHASRIRKEGPSLQLTEHTAGGLALALHELATNALKYGALKDPHGSIDLTWGTQDGKVRIVWKEHVNHSVSAPMRSGFGSRLIKTAMSGARDGKTEVNFLPDGLECVFEFQIPNASPAANP